MRWRMPFRRRRSGVQDGIPGDFVEYDALGAVRGQMERLGQVPGDRLSLAVFIGSQPDGLCCGCGVFQLGYDLLLVGGDDIIRPEAGVGIDGKLVGGQVADVAETGFDGIILAQELLDGLRLGGRLDDN